MSGNILHSKVCDAMYWTALQGYCWQYWREKPDNMYIQSQLAKTFKLFVKVKIKSMKK